MSERAATECLLRKAPFHFKHIFGFLTLTLQFGKGGGLFMWDRVEEAERLTRGG